MEEIILKHVNREPLTPGEEAKLENWLAKSEKNQIIFNQLKLALKGPDKKELGQMKDEIWINFSSSVEEDFQPSNSKKVEKVIWFRYAAGLLLLATMAALFYFYTRPAVEPTVANTIVMLEKESLKGQRLTFSLPDGSIVKLNSGSKITFPRFFDEKTREVSLEGEAFFQVAEEQERPFVVFSRDVQTEVLGTSFNIRAYHEDPLVQVAVKSGRVAVSAQETGKSLVLAPKEMARYSSDKKKITRHDLEDPSAVFGWTNQKLVFKNNSLEEILHTLSRWYDVDFNISGKDLPVKPFTANYKNPTLEEVMISLAFAYKFEYKIEEKYVTIYK